MAELDRLDKLFVIWAFLLQAALILHFAVRRRFFETYTLEYGWIVYALALPAVAVSLILLLNGRSWSFWLGGFLFLLFAVFGFWVDYLMGINFRSPFRLDVGLPYVFLYLGSIMFYWWPVGMLSRPLWYVYGGLFVVGTVLNILSH